MLSQIFIGFVVKQTKNIFTRIYISKSLDVSHILLSHMQEGPKLISLPLNWFWVEDVSGQDKGVRLRYCWNHPPKPSTSSWGYITKKHVFSFINYPIHSKWLVITPESVVLPRTETTSQTGKDDLGGGLPSHRQGCTQRTVRVWLHRPTSTDCSQLGGLCPSLAMDVGSFWWARKCVGRMCRMRSTSCLQNINHSQEGTPLLLNSFRNRFNQ